MISVKYTSKAARQLRKIQAQDSAVIRQECNALVNMPHCKNVKALTNHQYGYRLRVGKYRVLFDFDSMIKIVSIEEVRKRDDRTY